MCLTSRLSRYYGWARLILYNLSVIWEKVPVFEEEWFCDTIQIDQFHNSFYLEIDFGGISHAKVLDVIR